MSILDSGLNFCMFVKQAFELKYKLNYDFLCILLSEEIESNNWLGYQAVNDERSKNLNADRAFAKALKALYEVNHRGFF